MAEQHISSSCQDLPYYSTIHIQTKQKEVICPQSTASIHFSLGQKIDQWAYGGAIDCMALTLGGKYLVTYSIHALLYLRKTSLEERAFVVVDIIPCQLHPFQPTYKQTKKNQMHQTNDKLNYSPPIAQKNFAVLPGRRIDWQRFCCCNFWTSTF